MSALVKHAVFLALLLFAATLSGCAQPSLEVAVFDGSEWLPQDWELTNTREMPIIKA